MKFKHAQSQFSSQAWWLMLPTAIGEFKFTAGASLGSASCSMSPEMLGADCQTTGPSSTGDKFCGTRVENLLLRLTQQWQQQPRSSWWENRWFSAIFVCFAAERWCVCLGTSRKRRKVCWDSWSYYGNHSWNQFPPLCRWVLGIFARPEFPFFSFFCIRDMNRRLRDEKDAQQSEKRVSHNHSVLPHLPINYYLSEDLCSPWTPKIYPTWRSRPWTVIVWADVDVWFYPELLSMSWCWLWRLFLLLFLTWTMFSPEDTVSEMKHLILYIVQSCKAQRVFYVHQWHCTVHSSIFANAIWSGSIIYLK